MPHPEQTTTLTASSQVGPSLRDPPLSRIPSFWARADRSGSITSKVALEVAGDLPVAAGTRPALAEFVDLADGAAGHAGDLGGHTPPADALLGSRVVMRYECD